MSAPNSGIVHSMTGFAQGRAEADGAAVTLTLKTVNHRFLDLRWLLPAEIEAAQPELERRLRARLRRGHVDIRGATSARHGADLQLDLAAAAAYRRAWNEVAGPGATRQPDPADILRAPGVWAPPAADTAAAERFQTLALRAGDEALAALERMRAAEGAATVRDLRLHLASLAAGAGAVAALRERLEAGLFQKLQRRLHELAGAAGVGGERLLQEAALLADRGAIGEELARLDAHLASAEALLAQGGEVGKQLDFLLQECNREVNTLLSKSSGADEGLEITRLGLKMKADLEKIREQAQNIE